MFGKITNSRMVLTKCGEIAERCWNDLPEYFPDVVLNEYVIMPNHFHGIIIITGDGRGLINQTPTGTGDKWILMKNPEQTLGKVIRHFGRVSGHGIGSARLPAGLYLVRLTCGTQTSVKPWVCVR